MRWVCFGLALFGCEASFTDLRPDDLVVDDAGTPAAPDAQVALDAGIVGEDAAVASDAGLPSEDAGTPVATVVAAGTWEGRGGYDASGGVSLEHLGGDRYALVTSEDFASASVPAPVLLVSDREALGSRLMPSDVRIATLDASQIRGAQRFEVTLASVPAYAWVYCEPFGVETARARLEAR
ncbi:MAG: hypothetical protein H6724_01405 [Sandaracinus sp.]|nr:hypothetical protein [Sandaracinus sp.]